MLVLSRKLHETIVIDNHITVTIVEMRGGKVRLGIDAPREIIVNRLEVHDALQADLATNKAPEAHEKPSEVLEAASEASTAS